MAATFLLGSCSHGQMYLWDKKVNLIELLFNEPRETRVAWSSLASLDSFNSLDLVG